MDSIFKSKINYWRHLTLPLIFGTASLVIPGVNLIHAIGIIILIYLFIMTSQKELIVDSERLTINSKYNPLKRKQVFEINTLKKFVYVDRSDAIRGDQNQSYIRLIFNNNRSKISYVKLTETEINKLSDFITNKQVEFEMVTKEPEIFRGQ